jgi:hypothetical protein
VHFDELASDPHAAAARFVADVNFCEIEVFRLGDAPEHFLNRRLSGGEVAMAADFAVGTGIGDGDGDGSLFFMHIEADVEFRSRN